MLVTTPSRFPKVQLVALFDMRLQVAAVAGRIDGRTLPPGKPARCNAARNGEPSSRLWQPSSSASSTKPQNERLPRNEP